MPAVSADPSHAYRRTARRLRGRLNGRPGELYRSLRHLSDRFDAHFPRQQPPQDRPCPSDQHSAADFATRVQRQLAAGVLPYSDRLALIDAAAEMGIGRFEANLIIAAIQHRCGHLPQHPESRPSSSIKLLTFLAALLIQSSIVLAAWVVFIH